jgi:hypothetical protein
MKDTIQLSLAQWNKIYHSIAKEYPNSVLLIRSQMRRVLGFTSRSHRAWVQSSVPENLYMEGYYEESIMLDFYDKRKQTMFLLKYSDYLNDKEIS